MKLLNALKTPAKVKTSLHTLPSWERYLVYAASVMMALVIVAALVLLLAGLFWKAETPEQIFQDADELSREGEYAMAADKFVEYAEHKDVDGYSRFHAFMREAGSRQRIGDEQAALEAYIAAYRVGPEVSIHEYGIVVTQIMDISWQLEKYDIYELYRDRGLEELQELAEIDQSSQQQEQIQDAIERIEVADEEREEERREIEGSEET